jgi:hypothetical protein
MQLRVRYSGANAHGEGEATDVSPRGARIESRTEVAPGTRLSFELDSGDGQSVKGLGEVTWCRPRQSLGGRTVYDLGVRFEADWLKGDRAPLARALCRFFASTDFEPARDFERLPTHLRAQGHAQEQPVALTVLDLSEGGLRVNVQASALPSGIGVGKALKVTFGSRPAVDGTVAWVADAKAGAPMNAQFGVSLARTEEARSTIQEVLVALGRRSDVPPITLEVV